MKKIYLFSVPLFVIATSLSARTYTLGSGKWTDATLWNNQYPGSTIKSDDIVVIKGQLTINTGIVVEGTLQVEKGASMVGMKDLVIAKSGKFVNNGNTVMKTISNSGNIQNNLILESMMDFDNHGNIGNNNCLVGGNNFNNFGGAADGNNGAYFVNNNLHTSHNSTVGKNVRIVVGNSLENGENRQPVPSFNVNAAVRVSGVELSVANTGKTDVSAYSIEKSTDGITYTLVNILPGKNNETGITYTDKQINYSTTFYRIKAINVDGKETVLPETLVRPATNTFTLATK